jgi:predicted transposase/invertase (TIGR01784 family)
MDKKSFFHDHGYKYLFSNPTMVKYLVTSFVKEDWVKEVDFTRMEKLGKEFIGEEYDKRESDIIYKVSYQGSEAYIYLLIEFQSTVDRYMALRVLQYICKFYLDLVEVHKYRFLPPVFPVVLYNGDEKWTAPLEFNDLIEGERQQGLETYIPKFRYYKIAENEFPKKVLMELNNLVSALFYIENSSAEEFDAAVYQSLEIIVNEEDRSAANRFSAWIRNLAERKKLKDDQGEDYRIINPWEVKNMLSTTLEKIRGNAREEGVRKGKEEGIKEGKEEGIRELIKMYLITRFGNAPESFLEELNKIEDIQALEGLALKVYQCQSIDEVINLLEDK